MANTIRLKRASGSDPGASDLVTGEVAIRTDNGKLFTKKDDGSVAEISGGGGIDDGDKGDITVSNSGATFTIDNDAVTFAKFQNITEGRIVGRNNNTGTGNADQLTPTEIRTILNVENGATADQSASEIVALIADQTIAPSTIDMEDDERIKLGASDDLQIWHDGTNSNITNSTGNLVIGCSNNIEINTFDGHAAAKFINDGAVELYHNNTKMFETASYGANFTSNVRLGSDSNSLQIGASQDLKLFHDGTHSKITNTTGTLVLQSDAFAITNLAGNSNRIVASSSGAVSLYHDDTVKLETASDKINFHAHAKVNADATYDLGASGARWNDLYIANDIDIKDDGKLLLGDSDDLQIYHDGSNSYVQDTGTGNLKLLGSTVQIGKSDNSEIGLTFTSDGSIQLRHDNSTKFETSSSGVSVTGTISSTDSLTITNENPEINLVDSGGNPDYRLRNQDGTFRITDTTNNAGRFVINSDGHIDVVGNLDVGAGLDVTGNITVDGNIDGADGSKLKLGTGDDLQLYHDGSNSYLNNATGNLSIQSDGNLKLERADGGEDYIHCIANGAVEIHHNGNVKIETSSSGVSVTGNITVSGTVDGRDVASDGSKLDGIASGATNVSTENIQDIVGGMVSGNSESGITVTYQDSDGTLDFSVASQTDQNFTTTLKNKLDGIAAGATVGLPTSGGELSGDLITHEVRPDGNNTRSLGTSSKRWSNVFTNDLHLSNKGGSNKVDNTWGDFTIQEGMEDLFLINNRNGKMFKFVLQEVG